MELTEKIKQPEGRRIEFKEVIPTKADLAKTIIAFANDAGGEVFLGVKNEPRLIVGVSENELDSIENQISNLINDNCLPILFPDISFLETEGKHIIRVYIHKGGSPPYYLKSKGKEKGTFIRVGSSNRLASTEIIGELERIGAQRSFDSLVVHSVSYDDLNYDAFQQFFKDKTGESVSMQVLRKLDLIKSEQGREFPTNALVLLSNDKFKSQLFPYAKVECARFKGTKPGDFIDQKMFDGSIVEHAELALNFIKRHISEGTSGYDGVYRNDRWEYPLIAIREVIRNAIIHRDYSLTGKDIKVAIFDDKIEITSPGKLMPTVDFNQMQAGQSDIRNQILAPVFKRLGIIEQWGNGLSLIADELVQYPEIKLEWCEPGMAFRVSFTKTNYTEQLESQYELQHELQGELQGELHGELQQELQQESFYSRVLRIIETESLSTKEISEQLGQQKISNHLYDVLKKVREDKLIEWTIPDKPKSKNQQYRITIRGIAFLQLLNKKTK